MTETTSIAELRVAELLALIGSNHVAPGAGSAGAVALALAAACACKAVAISLKHRPADAELLSAATRFGDIGRLALLDADRDSAAFAGFIHAKSADAAQRLVREGENVARLLDALASALGDIEARIEPSMAGDLAAARALAGAARCIQQRNEAETKASEPAKP